MAGESPRQPPRHPKRRLERDLPLAAGGVTREERRFFLRRAAQINQARGTAHRWTPEEARAMGRWANTVRWGRVRAAQTAQAAQAVSVVPDEEGP